MCIYINHKSNLRPRLLVLYCDTIAFSSVQKLNTGNGLKCATVCPIICLGFQQIKNFSSLALNQRYLHMCSTNQIISSFNPGSQIKKKLDQLAAGDHSYRSL